MNAEDRPAEWVFRGTKSTCKLVRLAYPYCFENLAKLDRGFEHTKRMPLHTVSALAQV